MIYVFWQTKLFVIEGIFFAITPHNLLVTYEANLFIYLFFLTEFPSFHSI